MANDNPFEGLERIEAGREVTKHDPTALEQLIALEKAVLEAEIPFRARLSEFVGTASTINDTIYARQLFNRFAPHCPPFDAAALQDYIHARMDAEDNSHAEHAKIVRGFYSGMLLYALTARNDDKRKQTLVRINGGGRRFDCLFYYANKAGKVVVQNVRGREIMAGLGSSRGVQAVVYTGNPEDHDGCTDVGTTDNPAELVYCADVDSNAKTIMPSRYLVFERCTAEGTILIDDNNPHRNVPDQTVVIKDTPVPIKKTNWGGSHATYAYVGFKPSREEVDEWAPKSRILTGIKARKLYERVMKEYKVHELLEGRA